MDNSAEPAAVPNKGRPKKRRPLGLMLCVALLSATMAFPTPPLVDPAGGALPEVTLQITTGYVLLSPLTRVLDQLTLLGVSQHIMMILTLLGLGAGFGMRGARGFRRLLRGAAGLGSGLALALALYAGVAYLPRPMPRIQVEDPELVAINFHSHSSYSHDVGDGYPVSWARAWHERAGYHAFVLSDHSVWQGVDDGLRTNPDRAGDGTLLLSGVEMWLGGEHIIALGDSVRYDGLLSDIRNEILEERADQLDRPPTFIVTIPGDPFRLDALDATHPMGVVGIEIHDGAPRGMEQSKVQRDSIIGWAKTRDLALISGWNNHGAGQTPTAWTLMRIPGWADLGADSLLASIESVLHNKRFEATQVVERPGPAATSSVGLVFTAPVVLLATLRALTAPERLVWLLYLLGAWVVSSFSVRRRI